MKRIWDNLSGCILVGMVVTLMLGEWLRTTTFSTGVFAVGQTEVIDAILSKQFQCGIICVLVCYHVCFLWLKANRSNFTHEDRRISFAPLKKRDMVKLLLVIWAAGSYIIGWTKAADGDRGELLFGVDQSGNASVFLAGIVLSQLFEISIKRARGTSFCNAVLYLFIGFLAIASSLHFHEHAQFHYRQFTRATGLWVNPNTFGLLDGVGLILVLSVLASSTCGFSTDVKPPRCRWPAIAAAMGMFLLAGLIRSLSRGSWIATLCGGAFVIWHASRPKLVDSGLTDSRWRKLGPWLRGNRSALLIIAVSICVLLLFSPVRSEHSVFRRLFSVANANDFSWRNRLIAYEGALQSVRDHPVFGVGWNNVRTSFGNFYAPPALDDSASIILNDYFSLAATIGVVGLVLFFRLVRLSWSGTAPPINERSPNSWIGWRAATVVLLVGFWFDGGLFKLALATPFWLFLELGHAEKCKCKGKKSAIPQKV